MKKLLYTLLIVAVVAVVCLSAGCISQPAEGSKIGSMPYYKYGLSMFGDSETDTYYITTSKYLKYTVYTHLYHKNETSHEAEHAKLYYFFDDILHETFQGFEYDAKKLVSQVPLGSFVKEHYVSEITIREMKDDGIWKYSVNTTPPRI